MMRRFESRSVSWSSDASRWVPPASRISITLSSSDEALAARTCIASLAACKVFFGEASDPSFSSLPQGATW